jgi:hypothetical protein
MTFKSESEIYEDLKTRIQTYLPEITNWQPGGIMRAILRVTAAAIRLLYVTLEFLYWNIFPTYADRTSLRRYYEDWGLPWDAPTTENARKTVLNMYRQKGCGTKQWFRDTVLFNFDEVTSADVTFGLRALNSCDILVKYHNQSVSDDVLEDIQTYFAQDDKNVCGIDVLIKTLETALPNV